MDQRPLLAQAGERRPGAHAAPLRLQHVDRPFAAADLDEPVPHRLRGDARGFTCGVLERRALREQRRERGRVRAARAVRRRDVVAFDRDLDVSSVGEQMVDGLLAVPARDDHRRCAELVQPLGELAARAVEAGERDRLVEVRRHDGRERKETRDQRVDRVVEQQLRARARDHHRVDDERHAALMQEVRDGVDDRLREQHPRLRGVDADVVEDGVELRADEVARQLVNGRDLLRVLRGQRDERGRAVHAGGREGLQVGLDPGTAARVGRCDRQGARNGRGSSLRRHDPDQVRRVCSQPRGAAPRSLESTLGWNGDRDGELGGAARRRGGRLHAHRAAARRPASRRSRTSSTRASASGSATTRSTRTRRTRGRRRAAAST